MGKLKLDQLEGGPALCAWFEGTPSFHDATLRELELRQGAPGRLVAHAFKMGSETDSQGYFVLSKHVAVTFTIHGLIAVKLLDFMEAGIMYDLDIETNDEGITISFNSSYGVHGWIKAKQITISFEPEKTGPK